jgi:hypothetical protein
VIPLAIRFDPAADNRAVATRGGGIAGWLRELFRPEPADVRRRRIEAEAAAQLGFPSAQPEHAAQ